ncbi:MAG: hypothetical protein AB1631_30565 [Acidobacteriota bacterium]
MKNKRFYFFCALAFLLSTAALSGIAQSQSIDTALAHQYFQEAASICKRDGGKLWGVSLCLPMIFADHHTRMVVANQSDREGNLTKEGEVFVGKLPERINIANTAVEWAGVRWTMVVWPLPENKYHRASLMLHESWHRIQNDLGFAGSGPANDHLDLLEGRFLLQLEWRALAKALTHRGAERKQAIRDALIFRACRRSLFPNADVQERALEMHEGLAEYTGFRLSQHPDLDQYAADNLARGERRKSFVRSFAYVSGPAYGILLDGTGEDWRKGLKPTYDFGAMLQNALSIKLPEDIKQEAARASHSYDGDALRNRETERDNNRKRAIAEYRARLVDGPVLAIPLRKMRMQFDPNNLQPFDSLGTVYPNIRIVDEWGILTVSKGALISPTFTQVTVSAPSDPAQPLEGDGWTLKLNAGWTISSGERKGDYVLKENK